jgi:hypothetical protein
MDAIVRYNMKHSFSSRGLDTVQSQQIQDCAKLSGAASLEPSGRRVTGAAQGLERSDTETKLIAATSEETAIKLKLADFLEFR